MGNQKTNHSSRKSRIVNSRINTSFIIVFYTTNFHARYTKSYIKSNIHES